MSDGRNVWDEDNRLFQKNEEEPVRHDVEGSLNEFVHSDNERTEVLSAGVIRADEIAGDVESPEELIEIEVGQDVIGSCGHKIGEVVDVSTDHVTVEKGFLVPEDMYVPKSAIHHANDRELVLNITREQSTHQGWDDDPEALPGEDEPDPSVLDVGSREEVEEAGNA